MGIGYIGLGAMGSALARRLAPEHDLMVFDLNPDAVGMLVDAGARSAENASAVATACETVLLCLPKSEHVRAVLFGTGGLAESLKPGQIVIDQTSGDPTQTRQMAKTLAESGVTLLDAPVSGGPRAADAGTIAIMASGERDAFDKTRHVLEAISPKVFYCGAVGSGQVLKLINNTISTCNRFAMLEAVALGLKNGLDLPTMSEVLNAGGAKSQVTDTLLRALAKGEFSANFALGLMLKDLNLASGIAIESGAPLTFGQLARGMLQTATNLYGADAQLDEIANLVASQAGTSFFEK